jgi:hypothetical protein
MIASPVAVLASAVTALDHSRDPSYCTVQITSPSRPTRASVDSSATMTTYAPPSAVRASRKSYSAGSRAIAEVAGSSKLRKYNARGLLPSSFAAIQYDVASRRSIAKIWSPGSSAPRIASATRVPSPFQRCIQPTSPFGWPSPRPTTTNPPDSATTSATAAVETDHDDVGDRTGRLGALVSHDGDATIVEHGETRTLRQRRQRDLPQLRPGHAALRIAAVIVVEIAVVARLALVDRSVPAQRRC